MRIHIQGVWSFKLRHINLAVILLPRLIPQSKTNLKKVFIHTYSTWLNSLSCLRERLVYLKSTVNNITLQKTRVTSFENLIKL